MAVQLPSPRGTFPGRTSQAAKRKGTLVALTKPQQGSWSALSFCISGCSRSVVMSCFGSSADPYVGQGYQRTEVVHSRKTDPDQWVVSFRELLCKEDHSLRVHV